MKFKLKMFTKTFGKIKTNLIIVIILKILSILTKQIRKLLVSSKMKPLEYQVKFDYNSAKSLIVQ